MINDDRLNKAAKNSDIHKKVNRASASKIIANVNPIRLLDKTCFVRFRLGLRLSC